MNEGQQTIAAISTPTGRGGIGIVRISGPDALAILSKITRYSPVYAELPTRTRRSLIHTFLIDSHGNTLDEIIAGIYPAEKSFTGEMTVEINCHGGRAVTALALQAVVAAGARPASAGEFTRRAFENGKIDLISAEGIHELISARTPKGVKSAWRQIEGGLRSTCDEMSTVFKKIMSQITAIIDFEVEETQVIRMGWKNDLAQLTTTIKKMLGASTRRRFYQQDVWIVLSGSPNAGKSSIFNAILEQERSLVSPESGTTRDHIAENIELDGLVVRITDTAGIRETESQIERAAIQRAKEQIESADLIVHIIDQHQEISMDEQENILNSEEKNTLIVFNKCDLSEHPSISNLKIKLGKDRGVLLSVLTREGWDNFMTNILEKIDQLVPNNENVIQVNLRQAQLLSDALKNIESAAAMFDDNHPLDLISEEISSAAVNVKEITGEIVSEDLLDQIFGNFCIGK